MNMPIIDVQEPASLPSDEEIEAQVFRDLEAAQEALRTKDNGVVVIQYPDNRSVFKRLRAWWTLRRRTSRVQVTHADIEVASEPDWPRHWATTKYL